MATSGILVTQFDYAKVFLWNNRYKTYTYTNGTGSSVTLAPNTVMAHIPSTNKVMPYVSTATDGSDIPHGILKTQTSLVVANGDSITVTVCVWGDVASEQIVFYNGTDTVTTVVNGGMSTDSPATLIMKLGTVDTVLLWKGIYLISGTENTKADNA